MSVFATFYGQISLSPEQEVGEQEEITNPVCFVLSYIYLNQGKEIIATQKHRVNLTAGHVDFCLLFLSNLMKYSRDRK